MTISAFANQVKAAGLDGYGSIRAQYRDRKFQAAEERQAAFDAEVAKVAREQNCHPKDARHVVNARRRHEHRLAQR